MVALFCLIDIIILLVWYIKSPMNRKVEKSDNESEMDTLDEDTLVRMNSDIDYNEYV